MCVIFHSIKGGRQWQTPGTKIGAVIENGRVIVEQVMPAKVKTPQQHVGVSRAVMQVGVTTQAILVIAE